MVCILQGENDLPTLSQVLPPLDESSAQPLYQQLQRSLRGAIENGIIDLGKVATDALYLALDPYPRKPDAVFEPLVEAADPEDHPFAALKALKTKPKKPSAKKPKGK